MARGVNNVVAGIYPKRVEKEITIRTDEDKIIAYLKDPDPNAKLSKKLKELYNRYRLAYDAYRECGSVNGAIARLIKPDIQGNSISRRTARRDIQMAQSIYSSSLDHNRSLQVDWLLEDIKEDIEKAKIDKDHKAVKGFRELYYKIISEQMGDSAAEIYKNLQPHVIEVGRFPEKLKTPLPSYEEQLRQLELLKKKKVTDILEAEEVNYTIESDDAK